MSFKFDTGSMNGLEQKKHRGHHGQCSRHNRGQWRFFEELWNSMVLLKPHTSSSVSLNRFDNAIINGEFVAQR